MFSILLTLIFILALAALAFWVVDKARVTDPFNWIAKAIIAVVALVAAARSLGLGL